MLYLERFPAAPLRGLVHKLWYAHAPEISHARERVLPTGRVQAILNLDCEFLHDCPEGGGEVRAAPALVVGARSTYEIVACRDMTHLIGVVFEPGGFAAFAPGPVDLFSNRSVALDDVWGAAARQLRDRLRELPTVHARLRCLEEFLAGRLAAAPALAGRHRHGAVQFALARFAQAPSVTTVRAAARGAGWSERRFSQVFREAVGLTPKVWCRLQRFQRAVQLLHAGGDVPWAELSLDCGFYDQSHFANEFRAFSGVDATTYSAQRTQWTNHVRV